MHLGAVPPYLAAVPWLLVAWLTWRDVALLGHPTAKRLLSAFWVGLGLLVWLISTHGVGRGPRAVWADGLFVFTPVVVLLTSGGRPLVLMGERAGVPQAARERLLFVFLTLMLASVAWTAS